MSSHRALVVIASLVLSVAAQAQQEPPLIYTGPSGRPAGGRGVVDTSPPGQEPDLVHTTVVCQPKPDGYPQGYAIIEIKGGLPIVLTLSDLQQLVQSQQGSKGQLFGGYDEDKDDFVVVSSNDSVQVLQGAVGVETGSTVTGLFPQQVTIGLSPPLQPLPSPRLVATVDANGDGLDDIVVAGPDGVQLYLNTQDINGVPSFAYAPMLSLSAPAGSPDCTLHDVTDIAVGDVDGDGDNDLAFSAAHNFSTGEVQIWKRLPLPSVGFTPGVVLTFPNPVASVELVQLNTDYSADLVVAQHVHGTQQWCSGIVSVYLNPGDGAFSLTPPTPYSFTRWSNTGTVPTFGAAGRIDGDNDLDLVFTQNDNIAWPPGTFAQFNPPLSLLYVENRLNEATPTIDFAMRSTRFTGKAVDPIFQQSDVQGIAPMPDHLLLTWTVDQNAGMGTVGLPPADEDDKLSFHATGTGDGKRFDVPAHVTFDTGPMPGDGATADVARGQALNALDLVVPNLSGNSLTVALGDGDGGFPDRSEVTNIATPPPSKVGGPRRVVLTDLTHDGVADAVVLSDYIDASATDWASVITVLHSDGTQLSKVEERLLDDSGEMAVADIDGDGNKDVVVTQHLGTSALQQIQVHFGDASGGLDPNRAYYHVGLGFSLAGMTGGLGIADVDGDSDPDVVVSYARLLSPSGPTIQSGVVVFRNDWSSTHTLQPVENVFSTGVDVPDVESLVLGQINGSPDIDVAVGLRDGTLLFARGNGTAQGFVRQSIDIESATQGGGSLALGKLDANPQLDIVSCKGWPAKQSDVQVLLASKTNDFAVSELAGWNPEDYDGATRPIVGDFDGDGLDDIAIVHYVGEVTDLGEVTVLLTHP